MASGAWKGRQFYRDPQQAVLHQADPRHGERDTADQNAYVYETPPGVATAVPEYIDATLDDWVADDNGYGLIIDTTPVDHELGYASEAYGDDLAAIRASAAAHGDDRGASRQLYRSEPPFQAHDERYSTTWVEGYGSEATDGIPALAGGGQRGLNGLSVNNPDGFRKGWTNDFWLDRKFYEGQRMHDARWLTPDVATIDPGQPAPAEGNPYTSPYASLARIITRHPVPMVRRQPPGLSESIETDSGGEAYGDGDSWVAG